MFSDTSNIMINYLTVQPEVIVGLGDNTEFREKSPPFKTVINLHIDLEDWLGDDLMECHPCYIVTEKLKKLLDANSFKGFNISEMEVTKAEYFDDNYHQNKPLPKFYWLQINGGKNTADVYIDDSKNLNVADTFLSFLKSNVTLNYLEVEPERNEFDNILDQMISESKGNQPKKG
jgi:hypothetical protein